MSIFNNLLSINKNYQIKKEAHRNQLICILSILILSVFIHTHNQEVMSCNRLIEYNTKNSLFFVTYNFISSKLRNQSCYFFSKKITMGNHNVRLSVKIAHIQNLKKIWITNKQKEVYVISLKQRFSFSNQIITQDQLYVMRIELSGISAFRFPCDSV